MKSADYGTQSLTKDFGGGLTRNRYFFCWICTFESWTFVGLYAAIPRMKVRFAEDK